MRGFLLARIAGVGRESVIEGGAVDILRMLGQMLPDGGRKIEVGLIWHGFCEKARPSAIVKGNEFPIAQCGTLSDSSNSSAVGSLKSCRIDRPEAVPHCPVMDKKRAVGSHGSWFAVVDGESLPCVHECWWESGATRYNDKFLEQTQQARDLVNAIEDKKRVILTKDKTVFDPDGKPVGIERIGYIAIYSVDEVVFDSAGLRFKFLKRLVNLE